MESKWNNVAVVDRQVARWTGRFNNQIRNKTILFIEFHKTQTLKLTQNSKQTIMSTPTLLLTTCKMLTENEDATQIQIISMM